LGSDNLHILFSNTVSSYFFLNLRDNILHPNKTVVVIHTITFSFSTTDSLLLLWSYLNLRSSVPWNSVIITDSNKLECMGRKFATLCHSRFFRIFSVIFITYYIN
jgi:hypothetical protein